MCAHAHALQSMPPLAPTLPAPPPPPFEIYVRSSPALLHILPADARPDNSLPSTIAPAAYMSLVRPLADLRMCWLADTTNARGDTACAQPQLRSRASFQPPISAGACSRTSYQHHSCNGACAAPRTSVVHMQSLAMMLACLPCLR